MAPLVRLTNRKGVTLEDVGTPTGILTSLGAFITGTQPPEPEDVVSATTEKLEDGRAYYYYGAPAMLRPWGLCGWARPSAGWWPHPPGHFHTRLLAHTQSLMRSCMAEVSSYSSVQRPKWHQQPSHAQRLCCEGLRLNPPHPPLLCFPRTAEVFAPYGTNGPHTLSACTVKGDLLLLFLVSANDKQWARTEQVLRQVVTSFRA